MNFTQKGVLALIGKFSGAIIGLFVSILLARYLGVEGVGQYQLLISTQTILLTILAMGFGNATIYFINSMKIDRKTIVSTLFKLFVLISIVLSLIFGISIYKFQHYFGEIKLVSIVLFVTGSSALLLYNVLMPVLYAELEIVKLQVLSLSSSSMVIVGILLFSNYYSLEINSTLIIVGISNVLTTCFLFYFLRKDIDIKIEIKNKLIKNLFSYGIKISATNLVFILSSNLVVFLMNKIMLNGFEAVGLFSRATAIANMFLLLPTTLGPLFYSKWAKVEIEGLHFEIEKALRITTFFSVGCAIIIVLFGEFFLNFLYGEKFIAAKGPLSILSISIIFTSITIIFTNVFSSIGKPMITLRIFIISLFITLITGYFLIVNYGIIGAAISVLFGIIYNVLALLYFSKKTLNVSLRHSFVITKMDVSLLIKSFKK